jgi:threonine dehydrogenase-like Zn-dependent dehydrogenase
MTFVENLMRRELRLTGCFMSYSAPFPGHEWTDSVAALRSGELHVDAMVSHRFPLSQGVQVFEDVAAGRLAFRKIMLLPE